MNSAPYVAPIGPDDIDDLVRIRREALASEPLSFLSSPDDDRLTPEFVRTILANPEEQAVFGFFTEEGMAGMVGILRESRAKIRHKAHIWGMYVSPYARGMGGGRRLLEAAIDRARSWEGVEQVTLGVTTVGVAATKMYESAGFQRWGYEPRAMQHDGTFVDESYYVLLLGGRREG